MEQRPGLVTRRDLLKRGAAVGGTVLWVAPLVQTLGMGRAFATDTSGDPCTLTLTKSCANIPGLGFLFTFTACIRSDCRCGSIAPADHEVVLYVDGRPRGFSVDSTDPVPGHLCYIAEFPNPSGQFFQARCIGKDSNGDLDFDDILMQSDLLEITPNDFATCAAP